MQHNVLKLFYYIIKHGIGYAAISFKPTQEEIATNARI